MTFTAHFKSASHPGQKKSRSLACALKNRILLENYFLPDDQRDARSACLRRSLHEKVEVTEFHGRASAIRDPPQSLPRSDIPQSIES